MNTVYGIVSDELGLASTADPEVPHLNIEETWVRYQTDTPKSAASVRTLSLGPRIASEFFDHRARTAYKGEADRVFCHPQTGGAMSPQSYAVTLRAAMERAKVEKKARPFHDGRHTAITNAAAAGNAPAAIQARAGHADFSTTQRYIDLAGVRFRDEAESAEQRILGSLPQALGSDLGSEFVGADNADGPQSH